MNREGNKTVHLQVDLEIGAIVSLDPGGPRLGIKSGRKVASYSVAEKYLE